MNKLGGGQLLPEGPRDVKSFRQLIIRIGAFYVDDDDQHDEESSLKTKPRFLVLQVIWPFCRNNESGLDVLFDFVSKRVIKFVLHTNAPGHCDFGM
ncbi:hypothetical protein B9Z55_001101 [Caenorhabditis nigoni]|nr:hypothetical protein B9Z55_001101 [Caenorhabditis nigoni]